MQVRIDAEKGLDEVHACDVDRTAFDFYSDRSVDFRPILGRKYNATSGFSARSDENCPSVVHGTKQRGLEFEEIITSYS